MPLRHSNEPTPRWLELCAGPFLVLISVFGGVALAFDGPVTFSDAAGLLVCLFLAGAGISLTIDTFFRKG